MVKICDFAAGKNGEEDILDQQVCFVICSMKYMSPEAINSPLQMEVIETGDIWSFGICMLESYSGHYQITFDKEDLFQYARVLQ